MVAVNRPIFTRTWFCVFFLGAIFLAWSSTWDLSYCATIHRGWPFPSRVEGCPCHDVLYARIPCAWGFALLYWGMITFCLSWAAASSLTARFKWAGLVAVAPVAAYGLYRLFLYLFALAGWYVQTP